MRELKLEVRKFPIFFMNELKMHNFTVLRMKLNMKRGHMNVIEHP